MKKIIYKSIYKDLIIDISKNFNNNDPFYSESELIAKYNVSKLTIRNALRELEGTGLIKKEQGKRTRVIIPRENEQDPNSQLFSLFTLDELKLILENKNNDVIYEKLKIILSKTIKES